jgi:hypothetical protein
MTVLASGSLGAGFTAFIVVLVLVIATIFLFRSMSKHLRKVPPTFENKDDDGSPKGDSTK